MSTPRNVFDVRKVPKPVPVAPVAPVAPKPPVLFPSAPVATKPAVVLPTAPATSKPVPASKRAPVATATPTPKPKPPPQAKECYGVCAEEVHLARFVLQTRDGRHVSYPYACLGLITCPHPSELQLSCHCGEVDKILIKGRGLSVVADALAQGRLRFVRETDRPEFAQTTVVVEKIEVKPRRKG